MGRVKKKNWFSNLMDRLLDPKDTAMGVYTAILLLLCDSTLTVMIVYKVPYTEIDWIAYMQEVGGYEQGERDYLNLKGDTGPLVYPAGFVHLFSFLKRMSGGDIFPAQLIFAMLYIMTQAVVMGLYICSRSIPPLGLCFLCVSKRIHSIFVLRLFNDCWAMFVAYIAVFALLLRKVPLSIFLFSVAVSIKMNVLLFAPGVLAVVIKISDWKETFKGVVAGVAYQVMVALPFLMHFPASYMMRAFEFSRVFMYKWSVNWKFIPEEWFVSKQLALLLLAIHLRLLWSFVQYRWFLEEGGPGKAIESFFWKNKRKNNEKGKPPVGGNIKNDTILSILFVSNFIGILCARSLHYQFYSWYFHTIPFLMMRTKVPTFVSVVQFIAIEIVWNIFPANTLSSLVLLFCHLMILTSIWTLPAPFPMQLKEIGMRRKVR